MANTTVLAKSASQWTIRELDMFHIAVENATMQDLFGQDALPDAAVNAVIMDNLGPPSFPMNKNDHLFFCYLGCAMDPLWKGRANDFAKFLLGMLEYDEPDRIIYSRRRLTFVMCGQNVQARSDTSVMGPAEDYLLIQEHNRCAIPTDREPQLAATATAAFYYNNILCRQRGQPEIQSKEFARMIMGRSTAIFYRIPVTMELIQAVAAGRHPRTPAFIKKLIPPVPNQEDYMKDVGEPSRRVAVLPIF